MHLVMIANVSLIFPFLYLFGHKSIDLPLVMLQVASSWLLVMQTPKVKIYKHTGYCLW